METMSEGFVEDPRWMTSGNDSHPGAPSPRSFGPPRGSRRPPSAHEHYDDSLAAPMPQYPRESMERVPSSFSIVNPSAHHETYDYEEAPSASTYTNGRRRMPSEREHSYHNDDSHSRDHYHSHPHPHPHDDRRDREYYRDAHDPRYSDTGGPSPFYPDSPNPAHERGFTSHVGGDHHSVVTLSSSSEDEQVRYENENQQRHPRPHYHHNEEEDLASAFSSSVTIQESRRYEDEHQAQPRRRPPPATRHQDRPRGKNEETVDWVHHDSPLGPAVSVFPKGYDWRGGGGDEKRQAPVHRHPHPERQPERRTPRPGSYYDRSGPYVSAQAKFDELEQNQAGYGAPARPAPSPASRSPREARPKHTMVEISPGVKVRLRGAAETKECVKRDFFLPCMCFSCDQEMFCIQDAAYVLCPSCRVVNPLENVDSEFAEGGLGLGFTMDDLASMQQEEMK